MIITAVRTGKPFPYRTDETLASIHFDTDRARTWRLNTAGQVVPTTATFRNQAAFLAWITASGSKSYWTLLSNDPDLVMDIGL